MSLSLDCDFKLESIIALCTSFPLCAICFYLKATWRIMDKNITSIFIFLDLLTLLISSPCASRGALWKRKLVIVFKIQIGLLSGCNILLGLFMCPDFQQGLFILNVLIIEIGRVAHKSFDLRLDC